MYVTKREKGSLFFSNHSMELRHSIDFKGFKIILKG